MAKLNPNSSVLRVLAKSIDLEFDSIRVETSSSSTTIVFIKEGEDLIGQNFATRIGDTVLLTDVTGVIKATFINK